MSEKDFSIKTKFYNWLEQCPLDRWQPVDERQYTDHKAVTIKFKIPDSDQMDKLRDMQMEILDLENNTSATKVTK